MNPHPAYAFENQYVFPPQGRPNEIRAARKKAAAADASHGPERICYSASEAKENAISEALHCSGFSP